MKIGIMGAMLEEIESIHSHMRNSAVIEHGGRTYYQGYINDHEVVLVFSRWGKVASAATATSLITEFGIDQLIFTGVAGSTSPSLTIGDVIISEKLYQHDMDGRPLFPRYEIPLTDTTFFRADLSLLSKAQEATEKFLSSIAKHIPQHTLKKFNILCPICLLGTIATGDQFISDKKRTDQMMKEQPETRAVEMEGAAVAQVCVDYNIPFIVIRAISDKADDSNAVDFPQFVKEVARYYSEQIILGMLR